MPLAFFTRTQTGKLVSRLNSDVIGAQQAFTSTLSTVLSNLISLVLVLVAMLVLSWQLTLAALVMLPIFLIPAKIVGRKLAELTRQQMQLNGEMSTSMTERFSVSGALLVALFGRLADEHDQFAARAGAVRDVSVRIAMNGRFFMTSLGLVAALATALVYGVGGSLAIDGLLTVGTLTALAGLLGQLYGPLTQLTNLRIDVMNALVSFDRVFEVLDLEPMIRDAEDAEPVGGPPSVAFENVSFTYPSAADVSLASLESIASLDQRPNAQVLHDLSFAVEAGQTVALVGRSGGGKTTMTHLIARLYDATTARVLGGRQRRTPSCNWPACATPSATSPRTRTCSTTRSGTTWRYARPEVSDERMWEVLQRRPDRRSGRSLPDGLDTVVGDRGYRLSGGERQRLAIARLLLKAPPIVVLDEATAHLDSESEVAVQRALDLAMEGRTSIVIAHRLSTVRSADLILVVDRGRIVQRGRHDDLLAEGGLYAELYRTQFAAELIRGCAARRPRRRSSNRSGRTRRGRARRPPPGRTRPARRSGAAGSTPRPPSGPPPDRRPGCPDAAPARSRSGPASGPSTRVPCGPSSSASCLISMASPGRSPLDAARPGIGALTEVDSTQASARSGAVPCRTTARPPAGRPGRPSRRPPATARSWCPSTVPAGGPPTLISAPSSRPNAVRASAHASSAVDGSARSAVRATACSRPSASTTSPRTSPRRATSTTRPPSATSCSAVARPSPLLAAVTTKTRSVNPRSMIKLLPSGGP